MQAESSAGRERAPPRERVAGRPQATSQLSHNSCVFPRANCLASLICSFHTHGRRIITSPYQKRNQNTHISLRMEIPYVKFRAQPLTSEMVAAAVVMELWSPKKQEWQSGVPNQTKQQQQQNPGLTRLLLEPAPPPGCAFWAGLPSSPVHGGLPSWPLWGLLLGGATAFPKAGGEASLHGSV